MLGVIGNGSAVMSRVIGGAWFINITVPGSSSGRVMRWGRLALIIHRARVGQVRTVGNFTAVARGATGGVRIGPAGTVARIAGSRAAARILRPVIVGVIGRNSGRIRFARGQVRQVLGPGLGRVLP
jgi:hypothetical protein